MVPRELLIALSVCGALALHAAPCAAQQETPAEQGSQAERSATPAETQKGEQPDPAPATTPPESPPDPAPEQQPSKEPPETGPPNPEAKPKWVLVEEVSLIVNEEIITYLDLMRRLEREAQFREISTDRQAQDLQQKVMIEETDWILGYQAGQDLGIDPSEVERRVQSSIERNIQRSGVVDFGRQLKREALDSRGLRQRLAGGMYRSLWEQVATGATPSRSGRYSKDRFVRPGYLKFSYRLFRDNPSLLEQIDGRPEEYSLQELIVGVDNNGGIEQARGLAASLRQRALSGEDFGDLVERYSLEPENLGLVGPYRLEQFRGADEIYTFLREAALDDVSRPIPIARDGEVRAWRLVRLHEKLAPVVPLFMETQVQQKIEAFVRRDLDELRLYRALNELYEAAYIWPSMVSQTRPPLPPRISDL